MRCVWLHFRVRQCVSSDKRLVQRSGWLQNDVLAAIEAEPIVCSALIRLNNKVVMAIRPSPNPGVRAGRREHFVQKYHTDAFLLLFKVFTNTTVWISVLMWGLLLYLQTVLSEVDVPSCISAGCSFLMQLKSTFSPQAPTMCKAAQMKRNVIFPRSDLMC